MKFGKDTEAECLPKINLYDPRATCDRSVNSDQLSILKSTLQSSLSESCFFLLHDMNPYPPQGQPQELTEEIISMEPVPGISDHVVDCASSNSFNETPFNDFYDISSIKFKEMMDLHAAGSVSITQYQIHKIQIETKGQSLSEAWFAHRKYRITASNFLAASRNTVEPSCKLKAMYYTSFSTTSTCHGTINESHVLSLYERFLKSNNLDVSISEVGLIVSLSHPYLGASLDGVVTDNKTGEKWGVEVKCPASKFQQSLHDILKDKKFFLQKKGHQISLKKSHRYFYQVQGQMFCADLSRVDFVVWVGDDEPLYTETIFFDKLFWLSKVLPGLEFFYRRAVLPEYFTRRVAAGKKLYLQGGWINHEE